MKSRAPLDRARVLRAAIDVADADGIDAVTMRRLAQELGVEAMSLYRHVANKDDVVEGMVDLLVGEIDLPSGAVDWKAAIRGRALSARELLRRHKWAPRLIGSRSNISPAMLRYMDSVIGNLRAGGFSPDMTHHAMHVIGARLLGFTQELFDDADLGPEVAKILLGRIRSRGTAAVAGAYPAIAAVLTDIHHDDDLEFMFGLNLILDGLERARDSITGAERSAP